VKKFEKIKLCRAWTLLLLALLLAACQAENTDHTEEMPVTYQQITQAEAKEILDTQSGYVLVDARDQEEFVLGHIPGAIVMPYAQTGELAPSLLPDKNQTILIYCRSGRRSKIAAEALAEMGYTDVREFGGIIDWEYEIVK